MLAFHWKLPNIDCSRRLGSRTKTLDKMHSLFFWKVLSIQSPNKTLNNWGVAQAPANCFLNFQSIIAQYLALTDWLERKPELIFVMART